jgi:hypothetical protein
MAKQTMNSNLDTSNWDTSTPNLIFKSVNSINPYFPPSWTPIQIPAPLAEPVPELEPHLQAMRYTLPHVLYPFPNGDMGVDYFPFEAHTWFPAVDSGMGDAGILGGSLCGRTWIEETTISSV